MPRTKKGSEFVKYRKGSTSTKDVELSIHKVWSEITKDSKDRAQAEILLGLATGSLSSSSPVPYEVKAKGSGLTGAEALVLLVLWDFAKDLGYDMAKDASKEMIVRGAKALWDGLIKKRVKEVLPADAIGREIHLHDDVK
jgi:hypothetical protein